MEKRGMKTDDPGRAHFAVLAPRREPIYNINQPHGGPLN
jgi:hypothetical protein